MSKIIFYLLILLILHVGIFVQPASALGSCESSSIAPSPKSFPEGATEITINFEINNPNVLDGIKRKGEPVKLTVGYAPFREASSNPTAVDSRTFSLKITDPNLLHRRTYNGTLKYFDNSPICGDVVYQIGAAGGACTIDRELESKIPPNSHLTIKFVGMAAQEYILGYNRGRLLPRGQPDKTKTGADGQGVFSDITIPGDHGDTINLVIRAIIGGSECGKSIRIDNNASPPRPATTAPVAPIAAAEAVKQCPKEGEAFDPARHLGRGQCTKAGGEKCSSIDLKNPGIQTAIGCIHTNPAELAKDILKFAIGIGGGLAFLMMLLGAFQMLTSAGNPDSLKAGQERLTSAVIGLLFVIFATLFLQIIGVDILKLPGFAR